MTRTDPSIRRAVPDDVDPVIALDPHGMEPARRELVVEAIDRGWGWVAESDGSVAGCLVINTSFYQQPFVWLVVVSSAARRRGIATALVRHAIHLFEGRRVYTSTNGSNIASRTLFASLGFEPAGRIDQLDPGDPELILVRHPAGGTREPDGHGAGRIPVLVVTGPPGVGKTTVAFAISDQLQEAGVPHAVIDLDALGWAYPRPADDPFHTGLRLANLGAVWRNHRAAGATGLVLATVVEGDDDVAAIAGAIGAAELTVVRLRADPGTLHDRLRGRELGEGLAWHLERADELGRAMDGLAGPEHVIDTTGRTPREVAADVLGSSDWVSAAPDDT